MKIIVYAMIATVTSAYAQSHPVTDAKTVGGVTINNRIVTPSIDNNISGIITPNQATGVTRFPKYFNIGGNMVVCPVSKSWMGPRDECADNGVTKWINIQESVPSTKKFVGFKVVNDSGSILVYWK